MSSKTISSHRLFVLFMLLGALLLVSDSYSQSGTGLPTKTQIVLLGTGNPSPDPDRMGAAVAIVVNGTPYIVDCGAGVVRRASAASRAGVQGLSATNLKIAFITHLHTDHTLGYPDLIFTPWVMGRKEPLEVYGPVGIKAMTEHILEAYREDNGIRINSLERGNATGNRVNGPTWLLAAGLRVSLRDS